MSNYHPINVLSQPPTAVATAVGLVLNTLVALAVIDLTVDQLAVINSALVAVIALFVKAPTQAPELVIADEADDAGSDSAADDLDPTV